jgi:hypothetical protein
MNTHPLNVTYLVVGLVFLGLSASWAFSEAGLIDADSSRWVLPVTLLVAGTAGLVASLAKGLGRPRRTDHEEPPPSDAV